MCLQVLQILTNFETSLLRWRVEHTPPPPKPECSALKLAPGSHVSKHEHYLPVANLFQAVLSERPWKHTETKQTTLAREVLLSSGLKCPWISTVNACESTLWLLKDLGSMPLTWSPRGRHLASIHGHESSAPCNNFWQRKIIIALPCFWCEGEADLSRFQTVGSVGNRWIPAWRFRPVDFADSPNPKCPNVGAFQPSQSQGCQQEIPKRCQKT